MAPVITIIRYLRDLWDKCLKHLRVLTYPAPHPRIMMKKMKQPPPEKNQHEQSIKIVGGQFCISFATIKLVITWLWNVYTEKPTWNHWNMVRILSYITTFQQRMHIYIPRVWFSYNGISWLDGAYYKTAIGKAEFISSKVIRTPSLSIKTIMRCGLIANGTAVHLCSNEVVVSNVVDCSYSTMRKLSVIIGCDMKNFKQNYWEIYGLIYIKTIYE